MRIQQVIVRRWKAILLVGFLFAALAAWPASQLQVLTDVSALLPGDSRAAADYRVFLQRFGGLEKVLVAIVANDRVESAEATRLVTDGADDLAMMLTEESEVVSARSGIEPEDERFFLDHVLPRALLLMDERWESLLRQATTSEALEQRVRSIRATLASPLALPSSDQIAADPLGLASGLSILTPAAGQWRIDPSTLVSVSADGRASLVIVTPARSEIDAAGGRALAQVLESAFEQLSANADGNISFAAIGGPLYAAHDETIIRTDLNYTLSGAMLGCALIVTLAFGSLVLPLASIASLSVGLVTTMMLLRFGLGSISSIGMGFGAILVGLGLDYGIHGTSQYCQHRIAGFDTESALRETFTTAGPGILTSALTTAAAFAVIFMAQVRPIWELGLVVSVGIAAILVSTATIGAACLVGADVTRGLATPSGHVWRLLGWVVDRCLKFATSRPTAVLVFASATTGAALLGMTSLEMTPDLKSMRPTHHPTVIAEQTLTERFPVGLDTTTFVTSGSTLTQALDDVARIEQVLRDDLGEKAVITSPVAWLGIPSVVDSRLEALAASPLEDRVDEFEQRLQPAGLDAEGFRHGLDALRALGRGQDPGVPPREEWPDWLRDFVQFDDGVVSVAVRVRLQEGVWPEGPPTRIRRLVDDKVSGVAIASISGVGRELRDIAGRDLRRLGGGSLLAIIVVVLLSFRGRYRPAILALTPVILGTSWAVGLWSLSGRSLDLFGVAVLPIVLGIGIDDGLHVVHGARRQAAHPIAAAVRASGRAMLLTTLTTALGFGCLAFSHIPGLRRGGVLVSLGVLACLVATIFVLPALESRFGGRT